MEQRATEERLTHSRALSILKINATIKKARADIEKLKYKLMGLENEEFFNHKLKTEQREEIQSSISRMKGKIAMKSASIEFGKKNLERTLKDLSGAVDKL